jgi:hypothetical protein
MRSMDQIPEISENMHTPVEFVGLAGMVILLVSLWLQSNLHHRLSRLEERCKDGEITAQQLDRSTRRARLLAIVATLLGSCLLIGAVVEALT